VEGVRAATAGDVDTLATLVRQAIAELSASKGGSTWARREARQEPVEASLAAAISDDAQLVLCGTIDDVVVGLASVTVETMADGALLAVIGELYVEPEARGVAVGEALMDAVVEWSRTQGCVGIDALALPGLRDTKNFFEAFGLVARAIVVHRGLS
jgi:GNAT superfamily N-acetyltransferase